MKRRFLSLTGIMFGMGSSAIMQTYLSVSMPSIVDELGGISLYNWIFGAYMLASTVTIPLFGKMADMFGRRKFYITGLIFFTVGLVLCGLSVSMPMLVACRILMGVGAGAVTPASLGIMGELFDERDFPRVFGLMGLIQVLSNLVGPLLGGFLSDTFSWRWGFILFLPLEIACAVLICFGPAYGLSKTDRRQKVTLVSLKELDWVGSLFLSAGLVCLVLGLQFISWREHTAGVCLTVLSILIFGFSVCWEKRYPKPLLPFSMLKMRAIRNGIISVFFLGIINNSSSTYLSLYYQNVLKKSATNAGILLIPMLVSAGIASALCGKLPKHVMNKLSLLLWLLVGISFAGISLIGNLLGGLAAVFFSIPIGLGLGLLLPRFLGGSQIHADDSNRAVSGGMVQLSRNLGGTMGVSLLGVWISGGFPIGTGLLGIFLSLTAISAFAFLYTLISSRSEIERRSQNDSVV